MAKKPLLSILFFLMPFHASAAEQIKINVKGLHCESCLIAIKRQFNKSAITAVESYKLTLEDETITLSLKEKRTLSDDAIKKNIQKAGYKALKIYRKK